MRLFMAAFVLVMLGTAMTSPQWINLRWLWLEWAIFMPIWLVLLWRWRCWNCHDRLLKSGGAHLEMGKYGKLIQHKTCGADLS